jgi:hypothetical protein
VAVAAVAVAVIWNNNGEQILDLESKRSHDQARKPNYMPIEDQIDEIVKCLDHLQHNGIDIGTDIQHIIDHRKRVKSEFPKI